MRFLYPAHLLICLLLLLSTGCGTSRPTDFYMLRSNGTPINVPHMPRTTLSIEQILLPGYLDRNGIVIRDNDSSSLAVPRFSVWAEPLQQGVQRVLADSLTEPLLKYGVTVLPYQTQNVSAWYSLFVEILRLDADRAGLVQLEARWTLVDRNAARVLDRGNFAGEEKLHLAEFGTQRMFSQVVDSESRLVQQFGRELSVLLPEVMTSHKEPGGHPRTTR